MNIDPNIAVAYDAPYPKIMVMRPNWDYGRMLMPVINSSNSEMTAITTYLYQHWNFNHKYAAIGDITYRIAKVEMMHMDMVASTIALLGQRPCFAENSCVSWNAVAIEDTLDLPTALKNNIESEKYAINFYLKNASMIKDYHVRALLERIAKDERIHMELFQQLLDSL